MALKDPPVHPASRDSECFQKDAFSSPKELVSVLRDCRRCRDLSRGKRAHAKAVHLGFSSETQVSNSLISMYSKCGSMSDARKVFDELAGAPGVVSWTCLIQGYVENAQSELGLEMFDRMMKLRCVPDARTYVAALSACADLGAQQQGVGRWLEKGKEIHSQALENRCCNIYVESVLLRMYSIFRSMEDARSVFDGMSRRDVVSWTTLLQGYVDNAEFEVALQMFERMLLEKAQPDSRTYVIALMACSALGAQEVERRAAWLERGRFVHSEAARCRCCNIFVENAAIVMYSKCRSMGEARSVFERMNRRDVVTHTSLLQGYVENDEHELAVEFFEAMDAPDARCFASALSTCAFLTSKNSDHRWLEKGKAIHLKALESSCCDIFVENAMLKLLARSGNMAHARNRFDNMMKRDVVSWTTMLQGYIFNGESELAIELYDAMRGVCEPDARTYVAAITACSTLAATSGKSKWLEKGKAIHAEALQNKCCNTFVENNLVDMYVKFGSISLARKVLESMTHRDEISWTCLMQGYVQSGQCELALQVFERMSEDSLVDNRAYVVALGACASLRSQSTEKKWLDSGKHVHSRALRSGHCDVFLENALIGMYSKRGETMEEATRVFDSMAEVNVVSWTSLITGYADNGVNDLALEAIESTEASILLDSAILVATFKACTGLMALETGKKHHSLVERHGVDNKTVSTSLLELYGKCGSTELAQIVFDSWASPDVYMWNGLLCGYSQQGDTLLAFEIFHEMRQRSVSPNEFTFTHILAACSHAGLTEKGKGVFESMRSEYEVTPNLVHYNCLVDLFGRANKVERAMEVATTMPCEADVVTWTTILGACSKWKNLRLGKVAYGNLVKLGNEQNVDVNHVLMSNLNLSDHGSRNHRPVTTTIWIDRLRKVHRFTNENIKALI